MMKGRRIALTVLLLLMLCPYVCQAKWVTSGGAVSWQENGKKYESTWYAQAKLGFVKKNGSTYVYKQNGKIRKGFFTVGSDRYYANKSGKLISSSWISSGGKKYRASKSGKLHVKGISAVGKYYYGFNNSGVLLYGLRTFNGKTYYLNKADSGRMVRNRFVSISKKKYFFANTGVMVRSAWKGKCYLGSNGVMQTNKWIGSRYVGSNGSYLTGLQKIGGKNYYFDEETGNKLVSQTKAVGNVTYVFDSKGVGTVQKTAAKKTATVSVESQYYSDPEVSAETLLAAIIYCEAGNQPYYGQVAVGLVITNRMRSSEFPSTLKEVIYAKQQFEPARTGVLTRILNNQSSITASCKKAAAEVMAKYKAGNYQLQKSIAPDGKAVNLKGYLFFMTKNAYKRLGMKSETLTLQDHVFFKNWIR